MSALFAVVDSVVYLGVLVWVFFDAKSREQSGCLWVLFCFLCPPIGLIAYGVVNGGTGPWIGLGLLLVCGVASHLARVSETESAVARAAHPPAFDWVATLEIAGAVLAVGLMVFLLGSALRRPGEGAKPPDDLSAPPPEDSAGPPPE
jgi:hypothetical protein